MADIPFSLSRTALAVIVSCTLCSLATAQQATLAEAATSTVLITGSAEPRVQIGGFGDLPDGKSPFQARSFGNQRLADSGVASIGGLTRLDAAVSDAYNADGYWSILSVRGYTLDNRFNYRRDGLPINAETAIALDNKERLELLKGTSGLQAGVSAPGGLVNLVVKRPTATVRTARLELKEAGAVLAAVDLGQRFGADQRFGIRANVALERLDPKTHDMKGHRSLVALAADWHPGTDTSIELETEHSRQTQPSAAGFSLLGNQVPDAHAIDPRLNLNHQPWSQPVVLNGDTASLRITQRLADSWQVVAHAMTQRLESDDRTAFPYGVYNADYECPDWCDRFAPDGSFTYWQYVSDNERRTSDALDVSVSGTARTGGIEHRVQMGVLSTRYRARFEDQVFDIAGTGRIDGTLQTEASAGYPDANTNRDERSTEWYLRDAARWGNGWSLWAGVRHTRLERESVRTSPGSDGLQPTHYEQAVTVPWLALSKQLLPQTSLYASWGQGLETAVVPNRARYTNRGQALPALKSRQLEAGVKHSGQSMQAGLAWFDIERPEAADSGSCDAADSCTRQIDGSTRHRGLEAQLGLAAGPWHWQGSAMLLDAKRQGSSREGVNGLHPVNVPATSVRLNTSYRVAAVPGLELQSAITTEGHRNVLPDDNSTRIPSWTRVDIGARWEQRDGGNLWTWRTGVDNLFDRRAWKESPYQFGHSYLYPLAPRTLRASVEATF